MRQGRRPGQGGGGNTPYPIAKGEKACARRAGNAELCSLKPWRARGGAPAPLAALGGAHNHRCACAEPQGKQNTDTNSVLVREKPETRARAAPCHTAHIVHGYAMIHVSRHNTRIPGCVIEDSRNAQDGALHSSKPCCCSNAVSSIAFRLFSAFAWSAALVTVWYRWVSTASAGGALESAEWPSPASVCGECGE